MAESPELLGRELRATDHKPPGRILTPNSRFRSCPPHHTLLSKAKRNIDEELKIRIALRKASWIVSFIGTAVLPIEI